MVSLGAFRRLESVLGSSTVTINGMEYGSVVIGESFVCLSTCALTHTTDNMLLEDLGSLESVLEDASRGSLITNNPRLCFAPSLVWTQRRDSRVDYFLDKVRSLMLN